MENLWKTCTPGPDVRRNATNIDISLFELKNVPDKNKVFCEIKLDGNIFARSSSKEVTDAGTCFWGETFSFKELPKLGKISIFVVTRRRKWRKPVGSVDIPVTELTSGNVEKWFPLVVTGKVKETPSIRVKLHYRSIILILTLLGFVLIFNCEPAL